MKDEERRGRILHALVLGGGGPPHFRSTLLQSFARSAHLSRDARLAQPLGQLVDVRLIAKWKPADVLGK